MRVIKTIFFFGALTLFTAGVSAPAFAKNKFETEVEKEQVTVKLVREVQRGGYDVVTTEELKTWIDSGKGILIVEESCEPARSRLETVVHGGD